MEVPSNFSIETHGTCLEKFFSHVFESEVKIKSPLNPNPGSKIYVYGIEILGYNGDKPKIFFRDYRDSDLNDRGVELLIKDLDYSVAQDLVYWVQKFINERLAPNL